MLPGLDWVQARLLQQDGESIRAGAPGITVRFAVTDLLLYEGEPVSAVSSPLDLQVSRLLPEPTQDFARSSCWEASLIR